MIRCGNWHWSLFVLSALWTSIDALNTAPVLLWGDVRNEAKPSLVTITEQEFRDLLTPLLAQKSLLVFLDEEAFECRRSSAKNKPSAMSSCHQYLSNVENKQYFASVEKPLETLRSLSASGGDQESLPSFTKDEILQMSLDKFEANKIFYVQLPNEEGGSTLQQDAVISSLTEHLKDKAFFMYSSSEPRSHDRSQFSWNLMPNQRTRRQVAENDNNDQIFYDNGILLHSGPINILNGENLETLKVNGILVKSHDTNKTVLNVTVNLNSGKPLTFGVIKENGYYSMYDLTYEDVIYLSHTINAPLEFSYYCGNMTTIGKAKDAPEKKSTAAGGVYRLNWADFQFQAFFPPKSNKEQEPNFSDPWHCDGYFSTGILMSLLIIIFMMVITFTGIVWLMDIKTMDRFDDPKGKSITINTSE